MQGGFGFVATATPSRYWKLKLEGKNTITTNCYPKPRLMVSRREVDMVIIQCECDLQPTLFRFAPPPPSSHVDGVKINSKPADV